MNQLTLLLASKSPRRRSLIQDLGFPYRIIDADVEEIVPDGMAAKDVAEYLARLKSGIEIQLTENDVLLTADTVVILNDRVIGKPKTATEAKNTLQALSGQNHTVITGVCLRANNKVENFSVSTSIQFYTLTDEEINHYVEHFEVMDKAGSYAIHEWIGKIGIEKIDGDFYSVMGLPVSKIYQVLKSFK